MEKQKTHHPKLFYAQGDIFDYEGGGFDAIIAFMHCGYRINNSFSSVEDKLKDSTVMAMVFNGISPQKVAVSFYNIPQLVNLTLNAALQHGRRNIGFYGIKVENADGLTAAKRTIESVIEWLSINGDRIESITMVDWYDSYRKCFK